MNQLREKSEKILCGASFCFYMLLTTYRLTNASLWFDETIEYWYSKIMVGRLPFEAGGSSNMYRRIVGTYQPPLYNVLMYFWLKLGDSEWWFRFFGVAMGLIGMIAVYKTVRRLGNAYLASFAVFFSSCIYTLVYYWQECAEYCLMLGALFWTIYFWVCLIENPGKKNIICFTISAVIPVYSQYGAVFPVAVLCLSALLYVILQKDRKQIISIVISYLTALAVAALPLYIFFLKKQMLSQQGGKIEVRNISFSGGLFWDMLHHFRTVFNWNFFPYYSDQASKIFLVIMLLMIISVIIFSHNKMVKLLVGVNVTAWLLYYFAVKTELYSYGQFGNRYNLFFIPMWLIMGFAVGIEFYSILSGGILKKIESRWYYVGICICFAACYACMSWVYALQNNWGKEECREVVKTWYDVGADSSNTIVYYAADSGFAYYVRQNSAYTDKTEENVDYMYWYRDRSIDEYREYVDSIYGSAWPDEIYIIASHTRDDVNTLASSIMERGYEREDLYLQNTAYLIRLTKFADGGGSIQSEK